MGLTSQEFEELPYQVKREALHLNLRDAYGTATELPQLARWKAGQVDDFAWLRPWCDLMRASTAAGKVFRRVNVVSEPLSDYQRWSLTVEAPMVAAGQDIRWVSRRNVSTLLFPGNDFWLFDDELVVFLHYTGTGLNADFEPCTDPAVIQRCRDSFEAVWPLGVPHREYRPAS